MIYSVFLIILEEVYIKQLKYVVTDDIFIFCYHFDFDF